VVEAAEQEFFGDRRGTVAERVMWRPRGVFFRYVVEGVVVRPLHGYGLDGDAAKGVAAARLRGRQLRHREEGRETTAPRGAGSGALAAQNAAGVMAMFQYHAGCWGTVGRIEGLARIFGAGECEAITLV